MKEIMQFSSTKERLKYLSGKFEEIVPKVATPKPAQIAESAEELIPEEEVKVEEKKTEEKPKKKKSPAKKKTKGKKDGEVQAK